MPKKKKEKSIENELSMRQKRFCELYVSQDFFGNGTQSYIEAYGIDLNKKNAYNTAKVSASENLAKPNIIAYINQLLEDGGLNDSHVDKQLLFVINQHADFPSKVAAIREYNKVRGRITNKIEHSLGDVPEWMKQSPNGSTA